VVGAREAASGDDDKAQCPEARRAWRRLRKLFQDAPTAMKTKRPLGWWDSGTNRTHSKRCANEYQRITATLGTLTAHPDYKAIYGFTHEILNLAAARSASGDDEQAKRLQSKLHRALKKISNGSVAAVAIAEASR